MEKSQHCSGVSEAAVCICSSKYVLLKHLPMFIGKHLWWSLFFNKGLGLQLYLRKKLQCKFFSFFFYRKTPTAGSGVLK